MKNFDLPAIAFTIIVFIIVVLVSLKLFPQWQASVPQFVVLIATAAVAAVGITAGSKAIIQKASRNLPAPANLKVKIQSQQFTKAPGSRPWTQEDPPKSEYGFDLQGVPNWASLWAQLIIANFGLESGSLHLELDKERSKVPSLFDLSKARTEFNPVLNLQGRTSQHRDLYIDLPLTERDPSKFAKQLGLIQREKYELVIRYWTEAIDSSKRPTTLPIKGDFQLLFDEVVEHWRDFNFAKLAKIAQEAKNSLL